MSGWGGRSRDFAGGCCCVFTFFNVSLFLLFSHNFLKGKGGTRGFILTAERLAEEEWLGAAA